MKRKADESISKAIGLVKMRDLFWTCPHWWSTTDLAKQLGVSSRTVQRWLYDMDELGCPLEETQPRGGGNRVRYRRMQV